MLLDHNRTKNLEANTVISTKSPRMGHIYTRHTAEMHGITRHPGLSRDGGVKPITCGSLNTCRTHVKIISTEYKRTDTTITHGKGPFLYTYIWITRKYRIHIALYLTFREGKTVPVHQDRVTDVAGP